MEFLLLRLPYLTQKLIFDQLIPLEILTLSFCSKRAYYLVRNLKCHSGRVKVIIDLSGDIRLQYDSEDHEPGGFGQDIIYVKTEQPEAFEIVKLDQFYIPMSVRDNERLNTYWSDVNEGLREVAKYACSIFNCNLAGLFLTDIPEAKWAVDWINTRQKSVKVLIINTMCTYNGTDHALSYILNELKVTERLEISSPFKGRSPHPDIRMPSMELDSLEIQYGAWMTSEHLLRLNSRRYYFFGTSFTNQDLNLILKHWTIGGFSRMKELSLFIPGQLNYDIVLDGLDFIGVPVERYYIDEYGEHLNCVGYDIRREMDDDMITLSHKGGGTFDLFLTSELHPVI